MTDRYRDLHMCLHEKSQMAKIADRILQNVSFAPCFKLVDLLLLLLQYDQIRHSFTKKKKSKKNENIEIRRFCDDIHPTLLVVVSEM